MSDERKGITLSKKSASDFSEIVVAFDKHLKEKGLGDELKRSTLAGKFGAMFAYALAYMKQVGISKRKREIWKDVHRQIRELILREPEQKPKIDDMEKYVEQKAREIYEMVWTAELGYSLADTEKFITQIISDARGLQCVPMVRIKPERMDHMDKGALIGKPREAKIKKKGGD